MRKKDMFLLKLFVALVWGGLGFIVVLLLIGGGNV